MANTDKADQTTPQEEKPVESPKISHHDDESTKTGKDLQIKSKEQEPSFKTRRPSASPNKSRWRPNKDKESETSRMREEEARMFTQELKLDPEIDLERSTQAQVLRAPEAVEEGNPAEAQDAREI